jgi:hypothetical protein
MNAVKIVQHCMSPGGNSSRLSNIFLSGNCLILDEIIAAFKIVSDQQHPLHKKFLFLILAAVFLPARLH